MIRHRPLLSVDLAQKRARRRVPKSVYAFIEGGTEGELTVRANTAAFQQVTFRPRVAVWYEQRDLTTTVMGQALSMPIAFAPAGLIRLAHQGGEILAAKVAGEFGTAVGVSTMSSYPIEQIAAATNGPVWYQIYFAGGRTGVEVAIERARQAACHALIVTVDSAVHAGREKVMAGRGLPGLNLRTAIDWAPQTLLHPHWLFGFFRDGLTLQVPNIRLSLDGLPLSIDEANASMVASAPTWADISWIREQWSGPVAIKGVLTADDARRAVDVGADAVIVSNHGGNALDGTPATLRVLPEVVRAVGNQTDVLMDGGVRRPGDVVKAIALGARAVLVGRAYVWGLAAGGEQGVRDLVTAFRDGMDRTLALLGCHSVSALDSSYVSLPPDWPTAPDG